MKIFSEFDLGNIRLKNRIVMAPMTRSRATADNIPTDIMIEYYAQRAGAGLIITEGTSPSPNGLGYPRIPGMFNDDQIRGWKKITEAVHKKGGKIFMQFMHTGRVSHPDNLPPGARILAPSSIGMAGEMYTDTKGMQPYPVPEEMTPDEIRHAQDEYAQAAKNAIKAGFDGIEIHGANGYLVEQFINPTVNQRDDDYGGSYKNRSRFPIEVAQKIADAIGVERTGIRFSPYGVFNEMKDYDEIDEEYEYIAAALGKMKLAYIHIIDTGAPKVPESTKTRIRKAFGGTIIVNGALDKEKAEKLLQEGNADLVSFARKFLANPDLVYRMKNDLPLNEPDYKTFYTPGEKGYTDYPFATG